MGKTQVGSKYQGSGTASLARAPEQAKTNITLWRTAAAAAAFFFAKSSSDRGPRQMWFHVQLAQKKMDG